MRKFRSPRRRTTRQRSGFKVAGDEKGSTCKILPTARIYPEQQRIIINSKISDLPVPILFKRDFGILGVGFYFKPSGKCDVSGSMQWECNSRSFSAPIPILNTQHKIWQKHGILVNIPCPKVTSVKNLTITLSFSTSASIDFFGLMTGAIKHPYLEEHDIYKSFCEKTSIYIPEILYLDPTTQTIKFGLSQGKLESDKGTPIVCKSCNRCSRFLPIDIQVERNTLSYSNHCASRAPCEHASFSRYEIEEGVEYKSSVKTEGNFVVSHYGHQLECKVCKKFFVNLPLNPLRDSTQHREDSLRRRALEVLVNELLGRSWIYHIYRLSEGREFDVAIWEKFGKKCFNCGIELKDPTEMDLDHTLPLAYLWPLDETATCLCSTCNSSKSDKFPIEFYSKEKLPLLSKLTRLELAVLESCPINEIAVKALFKKIDWFFDVFLADKDYQKVRKGKKAADLILHALHNVLRSSGFKVDLAQIYQKKTGRLPKTVTIA